MLIKANIELDAGVKSFATGLLPELIAALRRCGPGDLLAVISSEGGLGADLETWCRFTRNTLVDTTVEILLELPERRCGGPMPPSRPDQLLGTKRRRAPDMGRNSAIEMPEVAEGVRMFDNIHRYVGHWRATQHLGPSGCRRR